MTVPNHVTVTNKDRSVQSVTHEEDSANVDQVLLDENAINVNWVSLDSVPRDVHNVNAINREQSMLTRYYKDNWSFGIIGKNNFKICDQSDGGKCRCREGVGGRDCSQCLPGYWGFPDCQKCECNGHATTCDERTGTYIRTWVFPDSVFSIDPVWSGRDHIGHL